MQKDASEKTELGRRRLIYAVVIVVCVAGVGLWWSVQSGHFLKNAALEIPSSQDVPPFAYRTTTIWLGGVDYVLDIADTPGKSQLGLGGRDGLAFGTGMLFPYMREGDRCFWMKDMRFAIDIVWLDAQEKVIHIQPSLSPDTYPQSYCPEKGAQYVIELGAGVAQNANLKVGDTLKIDSR